MSSAVAWLLLGTVFALISSLKLHTPGFLSGCAWLTYGRVHGAANAMLLYGWGCNAAFAIILWLLARLSQAEIRQAGILMVAGLFWNLGVTIGVFGILCGDGTSLETLEMPGYAGPVLFLAYLFIGGWAFLTYRTGRSEHVFISQWYVLGALFWFPWMFSIAQLMLFVQPVRGTVQSLVATWYGQGLFYLWFLPIGIGALYYFVPKILVRPISNYYLSVFGFWTLAVFGGWAGMSQLIGGPVPAWVVSVGIAASLMMLLTLSVLCVNLFPTMFAGGSSPQRDRVYSFFTVATFALVLVMLGSVLFSLRAIAEVAQFSFLTVAHAKLGLYGFYSMVAFGAAYYIVPRVTGLDWPVPSLVRLHFVSVLIGIIVGVGALAIGGFSHAAALNSLPGGTESAPVPMADVIKQLQPYLFARSGALIVILIGHVAFAVNVLSMAGKFACATCCAKSAPVAFRSNMEAAVR